MRCTISLQSPHFHLSESLSAKLSFTAERLLSNQRIRTDRPGMDLVIHKVGELQHVDITNRNFLFKWLARHTVIQPGLARFWQVRLGEHGLDFRFGCSIKHGRSEMHAESMCSPAQMGFQNLPDVHTRRHSE